MTTTSTPPKRTFPGLLQTLLASIMYLFSRRGTGGVTATAAARTTFAADLDREADRTNSGEAARRKGGAPEAAIALRSEASAVQRGTRRARRAERLTNKVAKIKQHRVDYEARARQVLTRSRTRGRVREAETHDLRSALTGYLTVWLPAIGILILAIAMSVNDPGFVYTTLRQAFDVPESVGILDVTNPSVVVALAAAVATTFTLLLAAHLVGESLGTLLFSGPVRNKEHPEVERTWNDIGPARMIVTIAIGGGVLAWFTRFLHTIAVARFEQDVTAVFGGADEINASVVGLITMLPIVVTAFATVAGAPPLAHARKVARWSLQLRITERRHVRRDQRLLRRERAAHRRALLAILVLTDILKDVGRRALAEIIEAALATGRIDLTALTGALTSKGETRESEDGRLPLDLSGTTTNAYLPGMPVVSNTVAHAINTFVSLDKVPDHAPLAADWRDLRNDPRAYQPYPEIEQITAPTTGADQHHTELHRVIPAVENTAATTDSAA